MWSELGRRPKTPILGHADGGPDQAPPPYNVRTVEFMVLLTLFDAGAAQRSLPPRLEAIPDEPGLVGLYSAPDGWGLSPFSAFFIAVPIRGYDSPDGSHGLFMAEGFYSGRAGPIMHNDYNTRLVPGFSRQWNDGAVWHGEAGPEDTVVVRVHVQPVAPAPDVPITAGVHHYLGSRPDGDLNIYSVAYSMAFHPAKTATIEFTDAASPLLRSLQPIGLSDGFLAPAGSLTFSPPQPVSTSPVQVAAQSARVSLMDLLSRLGRPAALVTREGRPIFVNDEARELLAGAFESGQLRAWRRDEQGKIDRALEAAVASGPSSLLEPVAIEKPGHDVPILVQVVPASAALLGEPGALILLSDPRGPAMGDPTDALQLLGLTAAEAKIAAAIGSGKSAREAAEVLSLTPNTVRSTLQVIYDKLGLSKQSELGRMVARLDQISAPTAQPRPWPDDLRADV
jgi:DNA-binding CsgD family transcriptional regulator